MEIQKKYAVMRHASYGPSEEITERGHSQIQEAVEKFTQFCEKNQITEVEIWHSPQIRAKNTAEIFCDQINIKNNLTEKNFLDCDNDEIQDNLPEKNDVFILMISHQPDIEHFLRKCLGVYFKVYNCDIVFKNEKL